LGCLQEKDPGPCFGYFPRYFFNSKSGSCEQFIYGGCQGNANRFETQEACIQLCS
ncbi:Kunitz-type serine protease inhibitor 4 protein, partial [Biomphalaria glabrata]